MTQGNKIAAALRTRHSLTALAGPVFAIILSFLIALPVRAESLSDVERFGRVAGVYIGIHNYIATFKKGRCGYAMKKAFPTGEEVLEKEVVPLLPPKDRLVLKVPFSQAYRQSLMQSFTVVPEMIRAAEAQQDHKTACGIVAGMLSTMGSRALEDWESVRDIGRTLTIP